MIFGGSREGKTHLSEQMINDMLKTYSWVVVISSKGWKLIPGKVVTGEVVTDSGELESGSDE